MKKKSILTLALVLALVVSTMVGCSGSDSGSSTGDATGDAVKPEYTLIAGSTYNDDYHYVVGMKEFEKEVEEKSGGRIDVQVYGSGSIVADDRQSAEMISSNQIQFGMAEASMYGTVFNDPRMAAATIPYYVGTDLDKIYKLFDEGEAFKQVYSDLMSKHNVKVVGVVNGGEGSFINTKHVIDSMDGFVGLKIRAAEADTYLMPVKSVGANPTPMSWGEVYTGLQQGTIDGCFSAKEGMYNMKFFEQCKYCLDAKVFYFMHTYAYSGEFYNSLPDDLKAVLDEAGANYMTYVRAGAAENGKKINEDLSALGVTVTVPSPEFLAEIEASMVPYIKERVAQIPEFMALIDKDMETLY